MLAAFLLHHPFFLASALVFRSALSGSLHSLDSLLGIESSPVGCHSEPPGPLEGLGGKGPEEAVLNSRTQGRLEQTHHFILCFRSCPSLDMFVWSSYECHLISRPACTRRKVCKKIRNCLLI